MVPTFTLNWSLSESSHSVAKAILLWGISPHPNARLIIPMVYKIYKPVELDPVGLGPPTMLLEIPTWMSPVSSLIFLTLIISLVLNLVRM